MDETTQSLPAQLQSVLFGTTTISDLVMLGALLFVVGVCGIILNRKNIITLLMSVELMLLAVNLNFVSFSVHLNDLTGQVFTMLVLTVAAAEAAIGLAILVVYFRNRGTIDVDDISSLKG